jgi:uncharacterized protein (TIGR02145 family)
MKRMIFLMLALLIGSAASMDAQVTIGSLADPHEGAVLDLSKTSKRGFLLPQVSLTDIKQWTPLEGTNTDGVGMMVYNVNETVGNGAGVYVWSGPVDGWLSLKSNFASAVKVTGFTLTPSDASVDIWVGGVQDFAVNNFLPNDATYRGVTWQITSGKTFAEITNMTSTSCTVRGLAAGTANLRVTGIDENYSTNVTIQVKPVTIKSFSLDKSSLALDVGGKTGTITAKDFIGSNNLILSGITVTWSIEGGNTTGSTINPATGNNTTTVTSGTTSGTFTVRATVDNISHDCVVTIDDCLPVTDVESHIYPTAKFGAAGCWMTQNLRSTRNNVYIDLTDKSSAGTNASYKYYWYPENKQATFTANPEYGLLYTWAAATGRTSSTDEGNTSHGPYQGICPADWHIPTDMEWNQLEQVIAESEANVHSTSGPITWDVSAIATSYRGTHAPKMKSTTAVDGKTNGTSNARNANGFDALLVGNMHLGAKSNYGTNAFYWSSSSKDDKYAWRRNMDDSNPGVNRNGSTKYDMLSIRCKKNNN